MEIEAVRARREEEETDEGRAGAKGWATRRVSGWALFIDSNEKVAVGA